MESATISANKRLLVLLPESLAGSSSLAHQIYWMANLEQRDVLYLTLLENQNNRLGLMRRMATMCAITSGQPPHVQFQLVEREDWLSTLREACQPGDLVICHTEQTVSTGFLRTQRMEDYLQTALPIPSRAIAGFYHPGKEQARRWLFSILFWLGCLLILAGFSALEIEIDRATQGVARIGLILFAICAEFGLLSAWNHLPKI